MTKIITALALFLFFSISVNAQKLPFQGYLEESGVPVEGTRNFTFNLTAYGWTETLNSVPVSNGIYNVVLGSTTPLPNTIFQGVSETPLSITVNGTALGNVTLYKPLVNGSSIVPNGGNIFINNSNNDLASWLGSPGSNGFIQLRSYDDTNALNGALQLGAFTGANALPEVYLEGTAQINYGLGRFRLIELPSGEEGARLELNKSNGGGQATLSIDQDGTGADQTGASGRLELFGDSSPNFMIQSASWEDHDLANMSAYGSIPDGGGWYFSVLDLGATRTGDGTQEYGFLELKNNASGVSNNTLSISGNLYETGGGGIEVRNSTGIATIIANGANKELSTHDDNGQILSAIGNFRDPVGADPTEATGYLKLWGTNSFNAELQGKSYQDNDLPLLQLFGNNDDGAGFWLGNIAAEVNQGLGTDNRGDIALRNTDNGGISTDGLVLTSNLNASGGGGIEVKDNNSANRIILEGQTGLISSERASGGSAVSLSQNAGNGSIAVENAAQDVNFFYEAESNILDISNAGAPTITLDGATGNITAIGTVTSDRRLKKNIKPLENALNNTLKLRGTSYYWKSESRSDKQQIGVIAQEVEEVYPEFVYTNKDGMKSVNYAQMTAVLIEAVKELNAKIEKLESDNKELTTALNEQQKMNDRITKLEKLLLENAKVAAND